MSVEIYGPASALGIYPFSTADLHPENDVILPQSSLILYYFRSMFIRRYLTSSSKPQFFPVFLFLFKHIYPSLHPSVDRPCSGLKICVHHHEGVVLSRKTCREIHISCCQPREYTRNIMAGSFFNSFFRALCTLTSFSWKPLKER